MLRKKRKYIKSGLYTNPTTHRFCEFEQPDDILHRKEIAGEIEKQVSFLPRRMQRAFRLWMDGKSAIEIATTTQTSLRAVEQHIFRAKLILRRELSYF